MEDEEYNWTMRFLKKDALKEMRTVMAGTYKSSNLHKKVWKFYWELFMAVKSETIRKMLIQWEDLKKENQSIMILLLRDRKLISGIYKNGEYTIDLRLSSYAGYTFFKGRTPCGAMTLTYKGSNVMGGYSQEKIVFDNVSIIKIAENKYEAKNSGYTCVITDKKKYISVKFTEKEGLWKVGKNGKYEPEKIY